MPDFMCFINHVDETDEIRTLTKFLVSAKDKAAALAVAKAYRPFAKRKADEDYDAEFDLFEITAHVVPLKEYVAILKSSGKAALREIAFAEKYAFVKVGARVFWNDPADGCCSQVAKVTGITEGPFDEDTIVTINDGTECPLCELGPLK